MDLMAKARALQAERAGLPRPNTNAMGSPSPRSGSASPRGFPHGVPGNLKLPGGMGGPSRPPAQGFPRSAPVVPGAKKPSLADRRGAMKLGGLPGGPSPAATPKLSDMNGGSDTSSTEDGGRGDSKMNEFKNYIDTQKGWITFDGAATITRTGVNFASGATFSISLDEVDILDELGKGNYGTVYRVRHARPKIPRFGQGLSGFKAASRQNSSLSEKDESSGSEDSPSTPRAGKLDGTTGRVMAMKEIRLELDEAKFTTILKELVILHECSSPYIIDFYGAFFQEGAVYMCIEYMDGGSIDKLYDGGIPENVLKKITYSTIMGLKSLKDEHNIIHRDVKPTNILVNTRGQVKICDFGVSGNLVASIAKTNIGCQSYMAPERISGGAMAVGADGTYSVQSDIWSLGLTIIECAMGKYPYPPEISATIFGQLNVSYASSPPFQRNSANQELDHRPSLKAIRQISPRKATPHKPVTLSSHASTRTPRRGIHTPCFYSIPGSNLLASQRRSPRKRRLSRKPRTTISPTWPPNSYLSMKAWAMLRSRNGCKMRWNARSRSCNRRQLKGRHCMRHHLTA